MASFCEALAEGDAETIELDSQRLEFDREQFEAEKLDKELALAERHEKRKATHELEMQKFRAMMDFLWQAHVSIVTGTEDAVTFEACAALTHSGLC